ncbi:MAG: hypothetical protein CSA97_00260 [Bacteroidetes bacterium]|nr:MAG: hypothetical protein CSA97_00260 [Bacteroidota bacterium]
MKKSNVRTFTDGCIYIIDWKGGGLEPTPSAEKHKMGCVAYTAIEEEDICYEWDFVRVYNPSNIHLEFFQPETKKQGVKKCDGVVQTTTGTTLLLELKHCRLATSNAKALRKLGDNKPKAEQQIISTKKALQLSGRVYGLIALPSILSYYPLGLKPQEVRAFYQEYGIMLDIGVSARFMGNDRVSFTEG